MRISLIYDNTTFRSDLIADWGFSCLIEAYGKTILFDTGESGSILLDNMKKMDIDPSAIDEVFISHAHYDHVGGLAAFLKRNNSVKIIAPSSFGEFHHTKNTIYVDQPIKLHEHIYSTGELDNIEQSMVIQTNKGLVVVVGCSHPKMEEILSIASRYGKLYAIVGGLHGFSEFELFKDLEIICPVHCTIHKAEIKRRYPDKCIEGGAGKIIEI